ncbi:hypothetical protein GGTG_11940 [Gaeumannomyces tritici R3-111a-1]|uniref:Uncharacterized protein n=1 Tax=Gaeumannomyces tritici (strain R3-111a-1) TaxID=644352 RepID=J3PEK9_GAET3|nr:hypothetical protein GGTG_11940 [Gaeumannomyces tritici R3-111a-1]EJT70917.1 hypothetical protein GGTG_11940 [Gaeumannomyces tritici R3-111a-1]
MFHLFPASPVVPFDAGGPLASDINTQADHLPEQRSQMPLASHEVPSTKLRLAPLLNLKCPATLTSTAACGFSRYSSSISDNQQHVGIIHLLQAPTDNTRPAFKA